jgi:N-dimethylarginine dimethylaminohydrolase
MTPPVTYQSTVELRGHLLDSLTLAKVLDKIQAHHAGYQVHNLQIGNRKDHLSSVCLTIRADSTEHLNEVLESLKPYGTDNVRMQTGGPLMAQSTARVRLQGDLIDGLLLAKALDVVQMHRAEFKLESLHIADAKQGPSQAELSVYSPTTVVLDHIIDELRGLGADVIYQPEALEIPGILPGQHPSNKARLLMCPPDFFTVAYAINPWMTSSIPCDVEKAKTQWQQLYEAVQQVADVDLMTALPDMPDLVFTANAAFVYGKKALVAHYKHPERQVEEPSVKAWFNQAGYHVIEMPVIFEGAGDALIWQDRVFAGYRTRTDIAAHSLITAETGLPVLSLELVDDRFYHIDTCLCPLSDGTLMYVPDAFDHYGNAVIEANVPEHQRLPVSIEEAMQFACNAVNVHKHVFLNAGNANVVARLQERGFTVVDIDMSEFIKSGGSAKCCTLRIA